MADEDTSKSRHDILQQQLEERYLKAKTDYYRLVLRRQDDLVRQRLQKIPDNWEDYEKNRLASDPVITEEKQKRLSDIKQRKSWELKFESLNVYFINSIENTFMDILNHRNIDESSLLDAIDSVNNIALEIGANVSDLKFLLLSLAKRGVSDLYYVMTAYDRYKKKQFSSFDEQFGSFCDDCIRIFRGYLNVMRNILIFHQTSRFIEKFFQKSSSSRGWKIREQEIKAYLEEKDSEITIIDLRKIIVVADQYRKTMRDDYRFLAYYYNDRDGKLFRYNFIADSLKSKLDDGLVSSRVYEGFGLIRSSFKALKEFHEESGLEEFGNAGFNYQEILEFIIKTGKIIEYFFLRSSRYEDLQNLRNDILYHAQEEYHRINPDADRL